MTPLQISNCFVPAIRLLVAILAFVSAPSGWSQSTVATPDFQPAAGYSATAFNLTITCATPSATIRYTTTGIDPSESDPVIVTGSTLFVGRSLTVKAKAWAAGYTPSLVKTALYEVFGSVAAGDYHSHLIKFDGKTWSFGKNADGCLGNGNTADQVSPVRLRKNAADLFPEAIGDGSLMVIAADGGGAGADGKSHSVVALSDGSAWCFGDNTRGQLGNGTTISSSYPLQVLTAAGQPLGGVVAVAAGEHSSYALTNAGTVYAWGSNVAGRLGNGSSVGTQLYAMEVQAASGQPLSSIVSIDEISAGDGFCLALDYATGMVWAWGANTNGELGDNSILDRSYAATVKDAAGSGDLVGVTSIGAGANHSLAVANVGTEVGAVWAWGESGNGRLGEGTTAVPSAATVKKLPVRMKVTSTTNWTGAKLVAGGGAHSLIVKTDRTLHATGLNTQKQLGDGTITTRAFPVRARLSSSANLVNVVDIAAGAEHSLALTTTGGAHTWGSPASGQLGNGSTTSSTSGYATAYASLPKLMNSAPTVTLSVTPATGVEPAAFSLQTVPSDVDGNLSRLDLFADSFRIGSLSAPPWTLTWSPSPAGRHHLTVVGVDSTGQTGTSNEVTVQVSLPAGTLPASGMRLWLKADAGAVPDSAGAVSSWEDQSGLSKHATQSYAPARPAFVPAVRNGRPVIRFDGTNDTMTLPTNLMSGATTGELYVVHKAASAMPVSGKGFLKFGSNPYGTCYPWVGGSIYDDFGSTIRRELGKPNQPLDQFHIYRCSSSAGSWTAWINGIRMFHTSVNTVGFTTAPTLGASPSFAGDLAEILIYDRALSDSESNSVEKYLSARYALAPPPEVPTGLSSGALSGRQISLSWRYPLGNVVTQFLIERRVAAGAFSQIAVVEQTQSWIDSSVAPATTYEYRIRSQNYTGASIYSSGSTVTTPSGTAMMPLNPRLWLKADAGIGSSTVAYWLDQSGSKNDASRIVGATPVWVDQVLNGKPVVRFSQNTQNMTFRNFMVGAPAGELFVVHKAESRLPTTYRTFMKFGTSPYDCSYPYVDGIIYDDFGSNVRKTLGVPRHAIDQFHLYHSSSVPNMWRAAIDGQPIYSTFSNAVAFSGFPTLAGNSAFIGDIAELIVYGHQLSEAERQVVMDYLDSKYLIPGMDLDADGLTNGEEVSLSTDPRKWDTNGDHLSDGMNVQLGYNPASLDVDGDGISNTEERAMGTDPFVSDSDSDGRDDASDAYPLDPTRQDSNSAVPGDVTPPVLTLSQPPGLTLQP